MKNILENLIQTIERNAIDNKATIHNVQLWAASWRNEMQTEQKLNIDGVMQAEGSDVNKLSTNNLKELINSYTDELNRRCAKGAAVASEVREEANMSAGCACGTNFRMTKNGVCVDCLKPVIRG